MSKFVLTPRPKFVFTRRRPQVQHLPQILARTNLTAKQLGLQAIWTRMLWRQWLPPAERARIPGPDAFDTTMQV